MAEVQLTFGRDSEGRLRHILEVRNGLSCACTCPGCGAALVAKNGGSNVHPHFAHASGQACHGGHESELHLLAKEILQDKKAIMLPPYGKIYRGGMQTFKEMKAEVRTTLQPQQTQGTYQDPTDRKDTYQGPTDKKGTYQDPSPSPSRQGHLQPDLIGTQINPKTGMPSDLWIEIRVTHEIGPEKYEKIKEKGIACIEIDLSLYKDQEVTRDQLCEYLLNSTEGRTWINNPTLERKRKEQQAQRQAYAQQMQAQRAYTQQIQALRTNAQQMQVQRTYAQQMQKGEQTRAPQYHQTQQNTNTPKKNLVSREYCNNCPSHTTRTAILKEMDLQKFPAHYKNLILRHPLSWMKEKIIHPMPVNPNDYIVTIGNDTLYLPTSSPDIYGHTVTPSKLKQNQRAIAFFSHTLPHLVQTIGAKCDHIQGYENDPDDKLRVVCSLTTGEIEN